ncbi:hypothetical protein RFI_39032, partial [Reticulomyxa filosa]
KQSWFVIEFKGIKSISTHYSLKQRITFDIQCWRNWKFESSDSIMDCSRLNIYCKAVSVVEDGPKCAKCLFKYSQDIVDILPEDDVGAARRTFHVVVSQHIGQELSGDTFAYSGDLDKQGLYCYWIGINFGTEEFQNPMKCGLVVVRSNGWMNESLRIEAIVGRDIVRFVTNHVKQDWFEIDFQNYSHLTTALTWDKWPKSKSKLLNVDTAKNVVQNSGGNDQWQTCKHREKLVFGIEGKNCLFHIILIVKKKYVLSIIAPALIKKIFGCFASPRKRKIVIPPSPKGVKQVCNLFTAYFFNILNCGLFYNRSQKYPKKKKSVNTLHL